MALSSSLRIRIVLAKPNAAETWLLLRASGTEPLLRVYCESCSTESVARVLEAAQAVCAAGERCLSEPVCVETKGILFDMDGVLISSIGSVVRCWQRWAEMYDVPNAEIYEVPHGMRAIEIVRSAAAGY